MNRRIAVTTVVLVAMAGGGLAFAGDDLTSLSYISYLERYATVKPGQGGETLDAVVNMPVLAGDRLDTARGARVELQLADGSTVWVDEFTTLDLDAIANSREDPAPRTSLYLSDGGGLAVEIPATAVGTGSLRLDTRAGTIFLNRPGLYRVTTRSGEAGVQVHQGLAELPEGYGSTLLRTNQQAWVAEGGDIDKAALDLDVDDFWSWVEERRHPAMSGRSSQYVDAAHGSRAAVLDSYGDWVYVDSYSTYMWRPRVGITWTPYSSGRWVWTPVGWTWVAYEPWGWYPYHYGSWYWDASIGWAWCWDGVWGPAWVHWVWWDGYVGWCPRGYYDYWYWHNHGGHGGRPGGHPGPGGAYRPDRWSDVALDFHGRVRLREIDSRPWTFVAADRFTDSHLDRVRLDPSRLLRDLPADRYGEVRSGPLLTPAPDRLGGSRTIDDAFRRQDGGRTLPEVSDILRREVGARRDTPDSAFRPVRTGDIVRDSRPVGGDGSPLRTVERRLGRERDDEGVGGPTSVRDVPGTRDPGSTIRRPGEGRGVTRRDPVSQPTTREGNPPSSRVPSRQVERGGATREVTPPSRSVPGTTREAPPPARSDPGSTREVSPPTPSNPGGTREVERPSRSEGTRSSVRTWSREGSDYVPRAQLDRSRVNASRSIGSSSRVEPGDTVRAPRTWTSSRSATSAPYRYAPSGGGSAISSRSSGMGTSSRSVSSGTSSRSVSSGSGSSHSSGGGSSRPSAGSRRNE